MVRIIVQMIARITPHIIVLMIVSAIVINIHVHTCAYEFAYA